MLTSTQILRNENEIIRHLMDTKREGIDKLINYMTDNGFFTAPASKGHHQNYKGGLAEHSSEVYYRTHNEIRIMKGHSSQISMPTVALSALLHDLCKIDQYVIITSDSNDIEHEPRVISNDKADWRHAEKSIELANRFITLTEEEEYAIRYHMGIYEKYDKLITLTEDHIDRTATNYEKDMMSYWNEFGEAIKKYPLVYLIHVADMKDTYSI